MYQQRGFTLLEMMVVIGIIAILSAVAIPAYQNYLRKAALTDMLQTVIPYRTAVELCAIDNGGINTCDAGKQGIPAGKASHYISGISVSKGVITVNGQKSLNGLVVVLTPQWSDNDGITGWKRQCNVNDDGSLHQACLSIFRSDQPDDNPLTAG